MRRVLLGAVVVACTACGSSNGSTSDTGTDGGSSSGGSSSGGGSSGGSSSGSGSSSGAAAPVTLEMDTWWTTASDLAPIQAVINLHETAHPNVTVNVVSSMSQGTMDTSITNRFATGTPPNAFQANPGSNALQFANGALNLGTPDWAANFPPSVLAPLTQNGKLIGVPLGLTRQNVTYWNMKVMSTLAAPYNAIPVGLTNFQNWITGVVGLGYTHPLCFGFKDAWVNAHIMFEDIVPAVAGATYSTQYWSGKDASGASSQQISAALDWATKWVYPYLTSDTSTMTMGQGVDRLMKAETDISQQCLMTAMGDWGGAQLEASPDNYVAGPGKDFDASGWPGAEGLVDFGGDAMVAATGAANAADITMLFETMASEQAQLLFAQKKGEIPARTLTAADQMLLPYLVQVDIAALQKGSLPGYKLTAKATYDMSTLSTQVQNYFLSGDKTALLAWLAQNYPNLQ